MPVLACPAAARGWVPCQVPHPGYTTDRPCTHPYPPVSPYGHVHAQPTLARTVSSVICDLRSVDQWMSDVRCGRAAAVVHRDHGCVGDRRVGAVEGQCSWWCACASQEQPDTPTVARSMDIKGGLQPVSDTPWVPVRVPVGWRRPEGARASASPLLMPPPGPSTTDRGHPSSSGGRMTVPPCYPLLEAIPTLY